MGLTDSGIGDALAPAQDMIGGGIGGFLGKYGWFLLAFVVIAILIGTVWIWKTVRKKDTQWTHKLKVRRVMNGQFLSEYTIIRMRRFPVIKKAEVFELEKSLLGAFLIPELEQYSGENEFAIILDKNNRIYTDMGSYFNPDKNTVNVSAKHAEIDIQRSNLKANFQNINKISKRVEWATIAKYAFMVVAIIAVMIVSITAIQNWGDAQKFKAESDKAQATAMQNLAEAMDTVAATVNTQKLEILPMMKEIYGTNNIQGIINTRVDTNETI